MVDQGHIESNPKVEGEVAIIGMACVFPKAPDLQTFWENIVSKVDAIDNPPKDRGIDQFFDPQATSNDRIYCKRGGYLEELPRFNPVDHGVMPVAVDGAEPEHFMALKIAHEALIDAGFPGKRLNGERTEVILGRGTYVNRGYVTVLQQGFVVDQTIRLLRELRPEYTVQELESIKQRLKAGLPPFNAETAPGLVPSIMASRIANRLDLRGPNFVVDAACASALIALEIGVRDLLARRCDAVLTGGVQISTPVFIHMIFTQLGALSRLPQLRPFDKDADGTMLGEGVGMIVLKRKEDAERDGHRIYALIKGIGSSSDGRAKGILAPRVEGEELALRRAYEAAGISPNTIELIEAHGTALPLGDTTEIEALRRVFGSRDGSLPTCAIGSVKSMIGHLIPAAGIAGLIKVALALYHKTFPPTLHCDTPNPKFELEKTPFYINTETRPWIHGHRNTPRRAGVNAFGFGGINTHAVLEEYKGGSEADTEVYHHKWNTELCVLQSESRQELIEQVKKLLKYLTISPEIALLDVAYSLNSKLVDKPYRLAIVASSLEDLEKKLDHALKRLRDPKRFRIKEKKGIYFFEEPLSQQGKLAFIFPGEGSQYLNMLSDLCLHFPEVRSCFDTLDRAFADYPRKYLPSHLIFPLPNGSDSQRRCGEEGLWQMDYAVDAVLTADRALLKLFSLLEIRPHVIVGHSSGEIMALEAAGAVELSDEQERMQHILAGYKMIQRFAGVKAIPEASLVAVGVADRRVIYEMLEKSAGKLSIAMDNCPNQVVICCDKDVLDKAMDQLRGAGAICQILPFSRPYHTPLFEPACKTLEEFFGGLKIVSPKVEIFSCMTAKPMPSDPKEVRKVAVKQWAQLVRFQETVESMYGAGVRLFVEVGPKSNLTSFVNDILKGKPRLAVASNVHHRSGITQLNHALGLLAAHGVSMRLDYLYKRRAPRELNLARADVTPYHQDNRKTGLRLSLALPTLSLGTEETEGSQDKQEEQTLPGSSMRSDLGNPPSGPATPSTSPSGQQEESLKATAVGPPVSATAREGTVARRPTSLQAQVMQEYLRTMERFLELQQQVMQTYLATGDSAKIAMSQGQTPNFQMSQEAANVPETAFPDRDGSDGSPAYLNAGCTDLISESGALPGSKSTAILDKEGIEKLLLSCISEKTGYSVDMLSLNQNLEADLGIDSIKRVEILGALFEQIGPLEEAEIEQLNALKTLRKIVDFLTTRLTKSSHKGKAQPRMEEPKDQHVTTHPGIAHFPEAASAQPLIGKLVRMIPGREVLLIREVDLEEDLFLHHHTLGGKVSQNDETLLGLPVFPLSMSLELMAEAAALLLPGKRLIGMKDIQAHNWIVLEDQRITLEVHARVRPESSENIDVQLRTLEPTSSQRETRLAVEGTMIFGDTYPETPTAGTFQLRSEKPAGLSPAEFYPYALFHGPLFQSVAALNRSGDNGVEATLEVPPKNQLFRSTSNPLFLSDPLMLDGTGQVVGLWAASHLDTNFVVFPIGLEEVGFYAPPLQPSTRVTCQVRTSLDGDVSIQSDSDVVKPDGYLQMRLKGLKHKRIKMPEIFHLFRGSREVMLSTPCPRLVQQYQSAGTFVCCRLDQITMECWKIDGGIWRAMVAHIVLSRREREVWRKFKGSEKRRTEWLLARVAGKDALRLLLKERYGMEVWPADVEIQADDRGGPEVSGEWIGQVGGAPLLSLAHSKGIAIALAADGEGSLGVGIDIELLRPMSKEFKGLALIPQEQNLMSSLSGARSREWLLRIWCAKEAVAKALGKGLMGIPRDLIARQLDSKTGAVSLELSGKFAQQFPQLMNKCLQAYTLRDDDLILASARYIDGDFLEGESSGEDGATISSSSLEAQRMPFIGGIISHTPGEELLALRQFDLDEDVFLLDHTLGREISVTDKELTGLPMMPLTVSMEIMAEAAALLIPNKLCIGMKDIRAYHWITFDEKQLTLRVEARRQSVEEVRVKLWESDHIHATGTSAGLPVLEGTIVFGEQYPGPPVLDDFPLRGRQPSIWSPEKLYSEGMFHGPRFQGVTSVDCCGEDGVEATLRAMPLDGFFRTQRAPRFVTDHVLLDTAGQLVAYWNAHHRENGFSTYPFRVQELHIYGSPLRPPEKAKGRARIRPLAENQFRADIDVIGSDGLLRMRVVGWDDRSFELPAAFYKARFRTREVVLSAPWPEATFGLSEVEGLQCCRMEDYPDELLYAHGRIWLQVLAHLVLSRREREIWRSLPDSQKRSAEWLLAQVAGKDAVRLFLKKHHGIDLCPSDIEIDSDEHGHPIVKGLWTNEVSQVPSLSISHTKGIGVAMAAEGGLGCGIDVERLDSRRERIGQIVLNPEERALLNSLLVPGDVEWHLRIGCGKKAAARALGRGLAGEPRDLIVRNLDTGLGTLSLEASGTLAREFPQLKGKHLQAQTMLERDLILASAVCIKGD